jgi:hypothetical protein
MEYLTDEQQRRLTPGLSVLRIKARRDPQAGEAHLYRARPDGRGVVGHHRSCVGFLAATTGTIGDPFVAGRLSLAEESHARVRYILVYRAMAKL